MFKTTWTRTKKDWATLAETHGANNPISYADLVDTYGLKIFSDELHAFAKSEWLMFSYPFNTRQGLLMDSTFSFKFDGERVTINVNRPDGLTDRAVLNLSDEMQAHLAERAAEGAV